LAYGFDKCGTLAGRSDGGVMIGRPSGPNPFRAFDNWCVRCLVLLAEKTIPLVSRPVRSVVNTAP